MSTSSRLLTDMFLYNDWWPTVKVQYFVGAVIIAHRWMVVCWYWNFWVRRRTTCGCCGLTTKHSDASENQWQCALSVGFNHRFLRKALVRRHWQLVALVQQLVDLHLLKMVDVTHTTLAQYLFLLVTWLGSC